MPQLSLIENVLTIIILATLFDLCGNISCEVDQTRSLKQFSHAMKALLDAKLMSNHWHVCSIVLVFLEHDQCSAALLCGLHSSFYSTGLEYTQM